jgi:hypothetical protein
MPEPRFHIIKQSFRADDGAGLVRLVGPSDRIKDDELVAERVFHDGEPADRDVDGLHQHLPAACTKNLGGLICRGDLPVRLVGLPRGEHDLGAGLRAPYADPAVGL